MAIRLTRAYLARVEDVNARERSVVAKINTGSVDRYRTVVDPRGIALANYRSNPVVLWEHGRDLARGAMPVGRNDWIRPAIGPDGPELIAKTLFHTGYVWSLAFSPDGATLASGSGDFTVRLWETVPLKTRYQARREAATLRPVAERLAEPLLRPKNSPAAVAKALGADRTLRDPLRQAVLRAVLRKAQPPEAAPGNAPDAP